MPCLVCEKKIPLLRQLAGSLYCSKEHSDQHAAINSSPPLAEFAANTPIYALLEALPDTGAFEPIPRFCDVILCRPVLNTRLAMEERRSPSIAWFPLPAPPEAGRVIGSDDGSGRWPKLRLGVAVSSPLSAQRRLTTAMSIASIAASPPPPARALMLVGQVPNLPRAAPGAHAGLENCSTPPGLRLCEGGFPLALSPCGLRSSPRICGNPNLGQCGLRLTPGSCHYGPARAALRPLGQVSDSFALNHSPHTSAGARFLWPPAMIAFDYSLPGTMLPLGGCIAERRLEFLLQPRIGAFDSEAASTALQSLSGIADLFSVIDVAVAPWTPTLIPPGPSLVLLSPEPCSPAAARLRASLRPARESFGDGREPAPPTQPAIEPAAFRRALSVPRVLCELDITQTQVLHTEPVWTIAAFVAELPPDAFSALAQPLSASVPFSLRAAWLPALSLIARPVTALRLAAQPDRGAMEFPACACEDLVHANGPGFAGALVFPRAGPAYSDARDTNRSRSARNIAPPQAIPVVYPWDRALRYWNSVPGFTRGIALGIPLAASILLFVPNLASPSPRSSSSSSLMAAIQARATVNLLEDFQAGLADWNGTQGWAGTWAVDHSGSARPGRLALYRPTIPLADYRLEFQGQIEAKGLGFAVRAKDTSNYYAIKLAIRKPGPLPTVSLVRYPVIGGRVGPKTELPLPMYLRSDTLYSVLVTVEGDHYTLTVNGQLVDAWSDSQLKSGGIGFFSDKGEISHLRSVHVVDHEDFVGWLCSQVSHGTADSPKIGVKHE